MKMETNLKMLSCTMLVGMLCWFGIYKAFAYEFFGGKPKIMQERLSIYTDNSCAQEYTTQVINALWTWGQPAVFGGDYINEALTPFRFTCAEEHSEESKSTAASSVLQIMRMPLVVRARGEAKTVTLATTTLWYTNSGEIVRSEIEFYNKWAHLASLRNIAMHEAGHLLGLMHSENPEAMMYYMAKGQKVLHADDYAGWMVLYNHCDYTQFDRYWNAFYPKATQPGVEGFWQGIVPDGGIWPESAYDVKRSECIDE